MRIAGLLALLIAIGPRTAAAQGQPANEADVRFVRGMIPHHQQALEMTALVPARAARGDVRMMAERMEVSQKDEIAMMERWLRDRGLETPAADAHAHHHAAADSAHAGMPGMATPEEMARLAAATGAEFDRMFLEMMIRHHEGALVMVAELFNAGGAQESQMYAIASDVDADQRMEIDRMRAMLDGPRPR